MLPVGNQTGRGSYRRKPRQTRSLPSGRGFAALNILVDRVILAGWLKTLLPISLRAWRFEAVTRPGARYAPLVRAGPTDAVPYRASLNPHSHRRTSPLPLPHACIPSICGVHCMRWAVFCMRYGEYSCVDAAFTCVFSSRPGLCPSARLRGETGFRFASLTSPVRQIAVRVICTISAGALMRSGNQLPVPLETNNVLAPFW